MHESDSRKRKHESEETMPAKRKSNVIFDKIVAAFYMSYGPDGRPQITWLDPESFNDPIPDKRASIQPMVASSQRVDDNTVPALPEGETISAPSRANPDDEVLAAPQVETISVSCRVNADDGNAVLTAPQVETITSPSVAKPKDEKVVPAVPLLENVSVPVEADESNKELVLLNGEECQICLETYEKVEDMSYLPCEHYFHKQCVEDWMKIDQTCPICRKSAANDGKA